MLTKYIILLMLIVNISYASSTDLGSELPLFSILPFIGILLSIAVIPLISPTYWHRNYGKISASWAATFLLPFLLWKGVDETLSQLFHVMLLEYMPFIILLLTLFTISGGIRLKGYLAGTPAINTLILIIGTILASWMGTTGAAMLLIRPLIRANKGRNHKVHTIVFFIFLVANIGGSLTPLGDPPLFLGFLHGVDFFWTTKTLFYPMIIASSLILIIYYILDRYYYNKESLDDKFTENSGVSLGIDGKINFLLLVGVVAAVLISGFWNPDFHSFHIFNINIEIPSIFRDLSLLILTAISLRLTDHNIRNMNGFTWFPILEVAKLFAGIFVTIIPVMAILKVGQSGSLSSIITMVTDSQGNPVNIMYFWLTGLLSSFLDNAPTYLVFFNLAGAAAQGSMPIADYLMDIIPTTLRAISAGAVFMGAMTYIGNAPNFMVKSIAEENNIQMPSFFGYMLWSTLILIPIFYIITFFIF